MQGWSAAEPCARLLSRTGMQADKRQLAPTHDRAACCSAAHVGQQPEAKYSTAVWNYSNAETQGSRLAGAACRGAATPLPRPAQPSMVLAMLPTRLLFNQPNRQPAGSSGLAPSLVGLLLWPLFACPWSCPCACACPCHPQAQPLPAHHIHQVLQRLIQPRPPQLLLEDGCRGAEAVQRQDAQLGALRRLRHCCRWSGGTGGGKHCPPGWPAGQRRFASQLCACFAGWLGLACAQ